ncbi:Galactokinase [Drechslerella dactyloides]|uniref:Galactokinase n=1 Tax=Drechslerella dactyloides TaxID=74499 RepID=A0AAD6ITK3_DREDA|nr:Galactokinase [Drechslerella dactyloides]
MTEPTVPQVASLAEIYAPDALLSQGKRWSDLVEEFKRVYDCLPEFIARAPGRVNIIGEVSLDALEYHQHIDYMLYQVLPMAVTADLLIAVTTNPTAPGTAPTVQIANLTPDKFPSKSFSLPADSSHDVEIDNNEHHWSNYFKCGLRGALELLRGKGWTETPVSMKVLVHGTVPSGAGLSSSAAFTCASALAVLTANGQQEVTKAELVDLAVVSERFVGVNSGGMDQTASVFGDKDSALYVSFVPKLQAMQFSFPKSDPPLSFLIAQTYVQADKKTTAPIHYNLRVVETTLAAEVLAKKLGVGPLPADKGPLGSTLSGLQKRYFEKKGGETVGVVEQLENMLDVVKGALEQEEGYTKGEIAGILGTTGEELTEKYMTRFPVRAERFQLRKRALHVFSEALRVNKFAELMMHAPENASLSYLQALGQLMNESQDSCRDLFDCSCPELDQICEIARKAGSVGSRLTGAGWGGCSVHLVPEDRVAAVEAALREEYYRNQVPRVLSSEEAWRETVVVSKPGRGAVVYRSDLLTF